MTYDQWKTRDPNDTGFYDMPEDDGPTELDLAYAEIERLQDAKRRALAIADDRSKENVLLRNALKNIAVYGCGMLSQPPAMNSPEEAWLRMRIAEYERCARDALDAVGGAPK